MFVWELHVCENVQYVYTCARELYARVRELYVGVRDIRSLFIAVILFKDVRCLKKTK